MVGKNVFQVYISIVYHLSIYYIQFIFYRGQTFFANTTQVIKIALLKAVWLFCTTFCKGILNPIFHQDFWYKWDPTQYQQPLTAKTHHMAFFAVSGSRIFSRFMHGCFLPSIQDSMNTSLSLCIETLPILSTSSN